MANANIFQAYLQPPKSVTDYMGEMDAQDIRREQLRGAQSRNALESLTMQDTVEKRRIEADDRNALQAAATASGGDPNKLVQALRASGRAGLMAHADALEAGALKRRDTEAQANERDATTASKKFTLTREKREAAIRDAISFRGPDDARASLQEAVQRGDISPEDAQRHLASIPNDPAQFAMWQLQSLRAVLGAKDQFDATKPTIQTRNTGGTTDTLAIDQLTGKPTVTGSVRNTVSPDTVARLAEDSRQFRVRETRERGTADAPTWDATNQVWVDKKARTVTPGTGPDGKPLPAKAGAATEDERKAAGWVSQAQFAFDNMEKALAADPRAAKPPMLPAALRMVPFVGESAANAATPEARQQFEQASSSFAEAALRAATGAGVNKEEALQKIRELTPQIGDKPGNIRQKKEALKVYLASLRTRAGRALPATVAPPGEPAAGGVINFSDLK